MAQQTTADAALLTIYKTWYTDKRFPNLLFRNSPLLKKIQKNRFQGQSYRFAAMYGRGGAVSGDYTVAVTNAASMSRNAEFVVTPGNVFSVFTVTQKEVLASQSKQGAYVKALINRMFAATEGARKMLAASMYGWGYGDVGQLTTQYLSNATSTTVNWDTVVKLDVGMQVNFTNYTAAIATPAQAYTNASFATISSIDGQTLHFTAGGPNATSTVGAWINISGGNDNVAGAGAPNMPTGLAQWLPYLGNRANAAWNTYVAAAFYGVTRSVATGPLCGWFYNRQPGELLSDAIVQGLKAARRGGGIPDIIVVNDEDFATIIYELQQNTAYYQMTNASPNKRDTNEVVRGISAFRASYSKSFVDIMYEDPYCPKGVCWILDSEAIEFIALNNVAAIDDGIPNNEPGSQSVESQSEPDTSFRLLIDDYINTAPNSTSAEGPAVQVSLSFFGNFVVHEPGHCAVVTF
jgi:hypothetical protein